MDLYALPPEEFTAARDAEVKAARLGKDRSRARDLAALRRPTVSAYAVNALARRAPELLGRLLALGPQLAEAQAGGDATSLRSLGAQRRSLVAELADLAQQAAGRTLTAAVRDEILATLEAALADPASAAAVQSGRLVRPLSYAGFGPVDLEGAVGVEFPTLVATSAGRARKPPAQAGPAETDPADNADPADGAESAEPARTARTARTAERESRRRRQAVVQAEHEAHDAAGRLDDTVHAYELARRTGESTEASLDAAVQAERSAEAALAAARDGRAAAERERRLAAQDSSEREDAVRRAQREADRAHEALDALRRA